MDLVVFMFWGSDLILDRNDQDIGLGLSNNRFRSASEKIGDKAFKAFSRPSDDDKAVVRFFEMLNKSLGRILIFKEDGRYLSGDYR